MESVDDQGLESVENKGLDTFENEDLCSPGNQGPEASDRGLELIESNVGLDDDGGENQDALDGDSILVEDEEAQTPVSGIKEYLPHVCDPKSEPIEGMEFESDESARAFYGAYAKAAGFTIRFSTCYRSKIDQTVTSRDIVCAKEGVCIRREMGNNTNYTKLRPIAKQGCKAMITIEKCDSAKWVVVKFKKEHTHPLESSNKMNLSGSRRSYSRTGRRVNANANSARPKVDDVGSVLVDPRKVSNPMANDQQSRRKYMKSSRLWSLGRDSQNILEYFKRKQVENSGFFYAIQVNDEQCMNNVFWADARSRMAYHYFGDVVIFDTTYKTNQYRMPFALFTGVNHHGKPVLFGCALFLDESESSFVWLFKTWLTAMSGCQPVSIITDQDRAIRAAVAQVFPEARHRFCKLHVLKEAEETLSNVYRTHPNFQSEFHRCINVTETVDEFESCWGSLLARYDLRENGWLQSLYNTRRQWVPVYLRDTFFAEMCTAERSETINSYFDGFVTGQSPLQVFVKQYERTLESSYQKEIEADFDTLYTTPVLKTPSPMEKQAAELYTKKIFLKFQEELVETFVYTANKIEENGTISVYRVAKFEEDNKAYIVTFNVSEMKANCSCKLFEFSGILCRHVLTVFTVTNVLVLPSHYILKRWTRNAKFGATLDEYEFEKQGNSRDSVTLRYKNLCREAIRYAEEGASFMDTYDVAINALRDAMERIMAAKKKVARVAQLGSNTSGHSFEDNVRNAIGSDSEICSSAWPWKDDANDHRANRIDGGLGVTTVADLNLPPLAPASLQRDEGPVSNTSVLPHLKSMTWTMENRNSSPANRAAVINMKLQDYSKNPPGETEVKFQLTKDALEATLKSMAYVSEQLSTPANKVAVINLKLPDYTKTPSGETLLKFLVSRDTLEAMLRSMAYISEQLSKAPPSRGSAKRQRQ